MISRTGSHTLKALAVLGGLADDRFIGAADLARRVHAPGNYLAKLLHQLSRAGVVEGRKGANGGFRLSRSASSIRLYDVLDPIEHLTTMNRCLLGKPRCTGQCPVHDRWSRTRDTYLDFLKTTTLADLAGDRSKTRRTGEPAAGGVT